MWHTHAPFSSSTISTKESDDSSSTPREDSRMPVGERLGHLKMV